MTYSSDLAGVRYKRYVTFSGHKSVERMSLTWQVRAMPWNVHSGLDKVGSGPATEF